MPYSHELKAATILANGLHSDVSIIKAEQFRTPDFLINGVAWELKSPVGNSSRTIDNCLRSARGQSRNIVVDLSRTRMDRNRAISRINHYLSTQHSPGKIRRLKVIDKSGKIVDIYP